MSIVISDVLWLSIVIYFVVLSKVILILYWSKWSWIIFINLCISYCPSVISNSSIVIVVLVKPNLLWLDSESPL